MRRAALLSVIAVFGYAANAQFTLTPQAGFEVPSTKISYNHLPYIKPAGQTSGQFGLRANYEFKGGFAPFAGIVTHSPLVTYNFSDPKTGMTDYTTSDGDVLVQLQTGLQYNSKPISLSKKTATKTATQTTSKTESYYSSCGRKYSESKACTEKKTCTSQKSSWTMRVQPSAGIGYVPSAKEDMQTDYFATSPGYTYNAGNTNTEFIGGIGFEFARNKKKFVTLSVNYFKGLGTNETSFATQTTGKEEITTLRSEVSGWNASLGIPISFAKKPASKTSSAKSQKTNSKCGMYYKSRCGF
jgi:hypothetical protein